MEAVRGFDLNIQKVLEHWAVPHGIREVIANALDESSLTDTPDPVIFKDDKGCWHIRDYGRGLQYAHFTQNENAEKLKNPSKVIGKFGVGLKDALATFDRHRVQVLIESKYGDITIEKQSKHGFDDVVTLHAIINAPSNPTIEGTDFVITGITDEDIEKAKENFLTYSNETILETTRYGSVIKKSAKKKARIYVNGLFVAEEENFLFSYNITSPTKLLLKALNRERTNVGRGAYSERIKSILLECAGKDVAELLVDDLKNLQTGTSHDEIQWLDVQLHACQILNAQEKVMFVTSYDLMKAGKFITYAQEDGYRVVVIPENLAGKLPTVADKSGNEMVNLEYYKGEWNNAFQFAFVPPSKLTSSERKVFEKTKTILDWFPKTKKVVKEVLISETMKLNWNGSDAAGLWEEAESRLIIRRDQLQKVESYAGTLIHEITHAITGTDDETMEFENQLTDNLGKLATMVLGNRKSWFGQ